MCMMFYRLVPCPGLSPKWCVCFGVCFSWSRLALFIAQTCTNHCNMQTNEAPFVRRKTSSGDSSMGHPPWGILHIAIPMRQYLSLMYTVSIRGRQCTRFVYRDSLTPFFVAGSVNCRTCNTIILEFLRVLS